MDRIIEVKVKGNHLTQDNNVAGLQYEGNVTFLRLEFDKGWDNYTKTVIFFDAYGQNPVKRILTADLLEDITESTRIYLCGIPPEPLMHDGKMEYVIEGYHNGKRQRAIEAKLKVLASPYADNAGEPTDPTPTQAEQIQGQIENILSDMQAEAVRAETARTGAEEAQAAAEVAAGNAETAEYNAEEAQAKAEQAASDALDSEKVTEGYKTNAYSYMLASESAYNKAAVARAEAEEAQGKAETAQNKAETAQANAEKAAKEAAEKATAEADKLLRQHIADSTAARDRAETAATNAEESEQNAAQSAIDAAGSANAADQYAQSVNPDEIRSMIASRGDGLYYDEATHLLYLTSGGEIISDGIQVASGTGGGGGGGESNNAVLTLKNTTGWMYKSVSLGASCPITFSWSSLEDEIPTGNGVLKVTVNGTVKETRQIEQGDDEIDVGKFLAAGTCAVKLNVTDTYGNSRSINFNITAVSLELSSTFDATIAYEGDITFPYTPTAAVTKTMHFAVDGKEVGEATVIASGRQQTFTIPAQAHGMHIFEAWYDAVIDGETVESDKLRYALICTVAGNTTPIIATDWNRTTVEQFDTLNIPYIVYDPASLSAKVSLSDGGTPTELTVDRTQQVWSYRVEGEGELTLSLACGTTIVLLEMTAEPTSIDVKAETNDLSLYLTSYGRSNNEENPSEWKYGNVAASLTGFNYTSDGWVLDEKGVTVLRVQGDARVTIPAQLFATDFRTSGKTIEIEFATRNVLNYDAVVFSCFSGERGIKITAQKAMLKSEQSEISTQYKEDEKVRLSFVVEKRAEHRLLCIYINGIMSGVVQYPTDDDFSQNNPVGITIGSSECTTDIYGIRVYENNLTRYQILDNWNADMQILSDRADTYKDNDIFDDYGSIVIDKLPSYLPYMVLEGRSLPTYKGNKLTVSGRYVDPITPSNSFTFANAEIDVQGTSSAGYERKNYKLKFKNGITQNGTQKTTYLLGKDNIPTDTFTFKADVASSEGANNVELAKLYNDISPYRIPPQETDARVRQGIDGYPCVIFHDAGDGAVFIGKYNFNHDKGTPEVFGFNADDESWEIKNNTSNRVIFKDADFSGTDWTNDFEARHPDKNTNIANLKALAEWIVSTDRDAVTSEADKAARLQKFRDELGNYCDIESTLFYYLFTELFLLADSRAKNAFPTRYDNGKWCWLPYDMDTAIGTNNEGKLAFDYYLEDTDLVGTAQVYTGQKSVLWNNVRDAFPEELMEMYQKLRSDGVLSYAETEKRFADHQAKWSAAIFNEDSYYKYLAPLFEKNNGSYLGMLQGSKAEQRKWWLYNRFRYIDSKYNAGDALTDFITLRGYSKGNIVVTPYADIYATVKYGSYLVQERALRGSSYTLECPVDDLDDTEIYIYSASQIANLGDLSALQVGYAEFASGTKLTSLKLGDASSTYSNQNLTQLYAGNNVLLNTLDVRNCPNLGNTAADVNATPAIDLSGCVNIEEVYFDNTAITSVTLPNGGILKKLHLPATVTNLTLRNQTALTEFVMPSYANVSTLRLENVSSAVDGWTILQSIPANSRVRMIGFDWTRNSAADILSLYDYLDTMRGLDENGNNVDKAQMQGVIHVDNITGAQLAEMQSRYPDIDIVYQHITSSLYFWNHDGTELLDVIDVTGGGDGVYSGVTPTREPTAQYTFVFEGKWSLAPNGIADSNALKNITADRNVYAAFTATVRTYTVTWSDGVSELEKDTNVPYGAIPTYNGSTPIDPDNYGEFTEWYPEISAVVGDITYTAQFVRPPAGAMWKTKTIGVNYSLAYGDGLWISSAEYGQYYTSTDFEGAWTYRGAAGASRNVYANGKWVHFFDTYELDVAYSTDGITQTDSNLKAKLNNVVYANGIWVACCATSKGLYYSEDAQTWTASNKTSEIFYNAIYENNLWVAVGGAGQFYSTDGKTWTRGNISANQTEVAYGNGMWVSAHKDSNPAYYSVDGKRWTTISDLKYVRGLAYGDGLWVAGGTSSYGLRYSTDGETWMNSNINNVEIRTVTYVTEGLWVAGTSTAGIYYSHDGKTWNQSNVTTGDYKKLVVADGKVIAVGNPCWYHKI